MRKGIRRSLVLVLVGTVPVVGASGCTARRVFSRATTATARTAFAVTKVAVAGTARATKKGIQAIARDPQSAPGGLESSPVAYNPLDPDGTRPADLGPSTAPVDPPQVREAGSILVDETPSAPMRGGQGVRHNLPSLDIETMIAEAKPSRSAASRK